MSGVLRGFPTSTYRKHASGENPCAALLIEKISHLQIGNYLVLKCIYGWALTNVHSNWSLLVWFINFKLKIVLLPVSQFADVADTDSHVLSIKVFYQRYQVLA
jgi:hypothetical protein